MLVFVERNKNINTYLAENNEKLTEWLCLDCWCRSRNEAKCRLNIVQPKVVKSVADGCIMADVCMKFH